MFAKSKVSQSMIDAVNKVLGEQPTQTAQLVQPTEVKEELLKEGWDDMVKDAKEKVKSGPKPSGGAGKKEGSRYGGSKQKDEKEPVKEELKGNQTKIDANHNGKIDGQDFAILRGKKKKMREHLNDMPFAKKLLEKELDEGLIKKAFKALTGGSDKDHLDRLKKSMYGKDSEVKYAAKTLVKHAKDPLGLKKEEVEQAEAESLIENFEMINEVSLGAKIKAYASHSSDAFEHGDMGNDEESEHHNARAEKIHAHILKHHGVEAANHADKAANSAIFGNGKHKSIDSLSGGLRGQHSKSVTKSGKIPKNTQSAMKNSVKGSYGKRIVGPKGHLPEEVEQIDELSKSTLGSYIKKSSYDATEKAAGDPVGPIAADDEAKKEKRLSGIGKAVTRLTKEEEQLDEMINEVLSKDASAGDWIHDFVHSKNPKFDGKSTAERKKMALGAYYGKQNEEADITTDGLAGRKDGGAENTFTYFKKKLQGDVGPDPKEGDKPEETAARKLHNAKPTDPQAPKKVDNLDKKYGTPNTFKEEKEEPPFEKPYSTKSSTVTDKSGAKHTPMSRARDLAQSALKKVKDKTKIKN